MASDAKTRASDADRDRAAAALPEHLAAGRLTIEEFDQRLDQTYAAKTLGELNVLMADLPRPTWFSFRIPRRPVPLRVRRWPRQVRRINPGRTGQVHPCMAGSLRVLARSQPVRLRDLADQRCQRRPVVLGSAE